MKTISGIAILLLFAALAAILDIELNVKKPWVFFMLGSIGFALSIIALLK